MRRISDLFNRLPVWLRWLMAGSAVMVVVNWIIHPVLGLVALASWCIAMAINLTAWRDEDEDRDCGCGNCHRY